MSLNPSNGFFTSSSLLQEPKTRSNDNTIERMLIDFFIYLPPILYASRNVIVGKKSNAAILS